MNVEPKFDPCPCPCSYANYNPFCCLCMFLYTDGSWYYRWDSMLVQMKEQNREVGISYWESPERKCLNECRLPLPETEDMSLEVSASCRRAGQDKGRWKIIPCSFARWLGFRRVQRGYNTWYIVAIQRLGYLLGGGARAGGGRDLGV